MRLIKIFLCLCICLLTACTPSNNNQVDDQPSNTPAFDFLDRMTLEELDKAIEYGENLYIYFGWTKNSQECVRFQENFLEPNIEYYNWNGLIRVVDLDEELPDALDDRIARRELTQKYGIKYAPSIIFIKFGKVESVFEWTPETNDLNTGVDLDLLREWMTSVNLMK
ncbi:MAG: hypothetical protein E7191_04975 [Erysipelotrichaceae bacterium]|nr:hypothetical protein [Erysipelotrichaceae bacterium]MBQ9988106.1 hypothetical protein [Erysipelotrichales bacterium]